MDMKAVLTGLLYGITTNVWDIQRPADSPLPALVYRVISDMVQDKGHGGAGRLHLSRVQITHLAVTDAALFTLVGQVQGILEGNKTNFPAALSTDIHIEDKESETVYSTVKDYYVQWTS